MTTSKNILEIKNLKASCGGKEILKGINLKIKTGEILTVFGPNGSGKTALLNTILGINGFTVSSGKILFQNADIRHLSTDRKARKGIALMFQKPAKVPGVKLLDLLKFLETDKQVLNKKIQALDMKKLINRELNHNFSGGELKRSELLQVLLQKADLYLLDEPDSGVDLENIKLIAKQLNSLIKSKRKSALIITHTGNILDYLKTDRACVLIDGKICCEGQPRTILETIKKYGYEKCLSCKK